MVDEATKPIVVSGGEAVKDPLQATVRYLLVILTAFPVIASLIHKHDIIGLIDYFRGNDGALVISAVICLGTMVYGIYKTRKRAAQVVTVASDRRVPQTVARLK